MYESTNGIYNMTAGRDLLTALGLELKFSENIIFGGKGLYEGCPKPMVNIGNYDFVIVTDKTVKLQGSFINWYIGKCLESNSVISSMHQMRRILDSKHNKASLNKVMAKKCQHI